MQLRRSLAVAVLATTLTVLPPVAADGVSEAQKAAEDIVELLPQCAVLNHPWVASCQDGTTFIGCGKDTMALYHCRLLFEGNGGEVDGSPATTSTQIAWEAAAKFAGSASRIATNTSRAATVVGAEAQAWQTWVREQALAVPGRLFTAKQPYQDTSTAFAKGVQRESQRYLQENAAEIMDILARSFSEGQEYGFTFAMDSGPVAVSATNRRPADDPCSPNAGLRLFGANCDGAFLLEGSASGALECNAYTSIALSQPCGGYVSTDWTWRAQGTPLNQGPARAARLTFGADGRAIVHDAFGVLYCNAPQYRNGYWLQTLTLGFSDNTLEGFGRHDGDGLAVFGEDAGTCTLGSQPNNGYTVTYEVQYNGLPVRVTGSFAYQGRVENFIECRATFDAQSTQSGSCSDGAIHGGPL